MTGIWTIGREREKAHAIKFIRNVNEHPLIFDVIDAVEDIKAGDGDLQLFMNAAIHAFVNGGRAVWGQAANWVRKMGKHHPQVHVIWDELAKWPISEVRWRVACVLYHDIPERQSHYLFDRLRSDKSKRVRQIAISRYEYTTDAKGLAERTRSAGEFDLARAIAELDARE
ncbi:hypothetical protein [Erythrobacter donghaensis]|uniref:hypothetical protein n=1 Tax=Erythrobacter donghaensis TaxID=267135 RepID=UPI00093C3310|nr:hypothetical protein [Erythrobacter donghaensis]